MVLWKKESNREDAMYVDLMEWHNQHFDTAFSHLVQTLATEKSDSKSIEFRLRGNEQFKAKNWQNAMELYNQSLRFACNDSENLGMAYANRASCFLHMHFYAECLVDIELAKAAHYPQRLMHKLIEREATCLKLMAESPRSDEKTKPALDFPANNQFPSMANVVEIRNNDEFGTHLKANSPIDVGKIILMDEAFVFDATKCKKSCCKNCLKFLQCFIPCPTCTDVMFCDQKCMASAGEIHSLGCGALYPKFPYVTTIIESILVAVNAFPNINELIEFIEKALATRDFNSPKCDSVVRSKYKVFLKSFTIVEDVLNSQFRFQNFEIYLMLMDISRVKAYFDTVEKQRFLKHLIWQHYFIIQTNSFAYGSSCEEEHDIQIMGSISSLFNHSCSPNVALGKFANLNIAYTVRPIQKGQQLFIKYDQRTSMQERRTALQENFHFKCNCTKCVPCYQPEDRVQMNSDPNFRVISCVNDHLISNHEVRSLLKQNCCAFLSRFGHLPWTPEIEIASMQLHKCISTDLFSNQL